MSSFVGRQDRVEKMEADDTLKKALKELEDRISALDGHVDSHKNAT